MRYAVRGLAKGKSYSLAVIGSLAVGIGATTAAFAIVNATFFRPFPEIHAEEELVRATIGWGARGAWMLTTWDDYQLMRQSAVIAKVTRAQLYGVSPMDPMAFGGATLLLLTVMLVASLVPARRAASINPVDTLRRD